MPGCTLFRFNPRTLQSFMHGHQYQQNESNEKGQEVINR